MAELVDRTYRGTIHPIHAALLAAALPLFLGTFLSEWAYSSTYEVQWTNFAAWLNAGGLVFAGLALLWAFVEILRADRRGRRRMLYFFLLLATFVLGFINALVQAKDVWAKMPEALILSLIVAILSIIATWIGFSTIRSGGTR